ncbi:MAG: type II toxin-antitoxin system VapC family toxin [Verrucomicrobia bacterium]|nr:type II toxin-antitoxin system VapC family toxin [Verrucomicrobiota bacterium]MBU4429936.1 type II toxin-antitoxin system VapC family toxin [Verrucomicrobiota bacterium]
MEQRDPVWIVPYLWRYEVQNILAKAIWVKQLSPEAAAEVWRQVVDVMRDNETDPSPEKVIELAGRYRITAYDATYVALAMDMSVLCVTENRELQEKFPRLAISMKAFVNPGNAKSLVRESRAGYRARRARR